MSKNAWELSFRVSTAQGVVVSVANGGVQHLKRDSHNNKDKALSLTLILTSWAFGGATLIISTERGLPASHAIAALQVIT